MTNFNAMLLEHTDVTLVSTNNQEVPCHRFILAARSPVFKRLFASQAATGELLRESIDSSTEALKAMVKYLYTGNNAMQLSTIYYAKKICSYDVGWTPLDTGQKI